MIHSAECGIPDYKGENTKLGVTKVNGRLNIITPSNQMLFFFINIFIIFLKTYENLKNDPI